MLEHIADFTAWPILTGILVGYVANRISHQLRILCGWCCYRVVALEETVLIEHE